MMSKNYKSVIYIEDCGLRRIICKKALQTLTELLGAFLYLYSRIDAFTIMLYLSFTAIDGPTVTVSLNGFS